MRLRTSAPIASYRAHASPTLATFTARFVSPSTVTRKAWRICSARVQFSRDLRAGVSSGDITVSFRLWTRPQVKVGNRYLVEGVQIEIDAIELLPFSSVSRA